MKEQENYAPELISKYLKGEASQEEIRMLEEWVKAAPANALQYEEMCATATLLTHERIESNTNLDAAWSSMKALTIGAQQRNTQSRHTLSRIPKLLRIAALIIILTIPGFLAYRYLTRVEMIRIAATEGVREVALPDGSRITLNNGSSIEYPAIFSDRERAVLLTGEAFFNVTPNSEAPFVVSFGELRVRVVGTSFNINTCTPDGGSDVVLATGKVAVYFAGQENDSVMLSPGERAGIPADHSGISRMVNEDPNYLAWKTGRMVFNDTPLRDVAATLSAVYHTPVIIQGTSLGRCRITATFEKQSLESVLNVIKATLNLQVIPSGSGFGLAGKGCN